MFRLKLSWIKGDRANFFFFRIWSFLNVALRCFIFVKIPTFYIWPFNTLTQTLPHLNSGFQHSQMGFLIMFDENIFHKKRNLLNHPLILVPVLGWFLFNLFVPQKSASHSEYLEQQISPHYMKTLKNTEKSIKNVVGWENFGKF